MRPFRAPDRTTWTGEEAPFDDRHHPTRDLRIDLGAVAQVDDGTGHAIGVETARRRRSR
jgi:hypothetical protein